MDIFNNYHELLESISSYVSATIASLKENEVKTEMYAEGLGMLLVTTPLYTFGGFALNKFANGAGSSWFLVSSALYLTGNYAYSKVLASAGLPVATVLSSCALTMTLCFIGHFSSDQLSLRQWAGVSATVLGVALIALPSKGAVS